MLYPQPLLPKDKVGLICPASPIAKDKFDDFVSHVSALGYTPVIGKHARDAVRYFAGTDSERAEDIHTFFADKSIKGIFSLRGGYGCSRILNLLDYELIKSNPKVFTGLSDITALQNTLLQKAELVSFSGLIFKLPVKGETLRTLNLCLAGKTITHSHQTFATQGSAEGQLIGGCLALFVSLLGTKFMPDTKNRIIILEDVHEEPYRIDCMLQQLKLAGVFENAAGVIFGSFHNCVAKDLEDGTIEEVIAEYAGSMSCPCAINFNYGHHEGGSVVPLGAKVRISSTEKSIVFNP